MTDFNENWRPPKFSYKYLNYVQDILMECERHKKWSSQMLNKRPHCGHKIRYKYVMMPTPGSDNGFRTCEEEAVWWSPVVSAAWCEEHIDDYMKELVYKSWRQIQTQVMFHELNKKWNF